MPDNVIPDLKSFDHFKWKHDEDIQSPPSLLLERSTAIACFGKEAVHYAFIRSIGPEKIIALAQMGRDGLRIAREPEPQTAPAGLYNEVNPPKIIGDA